MDALAEIGQTGPRAELSTLAPEMPLGIQKLGSFRVYAVTTSEDGTSSEVARLMKIDERNASGYRIVDKLNLTSEEVAQSQKWINGVFDSVPPNRMTPEQHRQLNLADEIVRVISDNIREIRKRELSSEPSL